MRPSKFIGIAGASLGLLGAITGTTCLILANNGAIPFLTENYRSYRGEFYIDDVLVYETTQKRGTEIAIDDNIKTAKKGDDEGYFYTFIGWDTNQDTIPDIPPNRMYYNFRADACYLKLKFPDINLDDFDLERLLEFLEKYNINLEDLLNFLGIDFEDFLEWLKSLGLELPSLFTVTSDTGIIAPYFRTQSFGDWNTKKKKWNEADYFDANMYLDGSTINPLDFTANKIQNTILGATKYRCLFDYDRPDSIYSTTVYQADYDDNDTPTTSDAYQNIIPEDNSYYSSGFPLVFNPLTIEIIKNSSFTSDQFRTSELKYRNYAYEHYLNVPEKYTGLFSSVTTSSSFSKNITTKYQRNSQKFDIVNNIFAYILDFCSFSPEDIIENYTYPSNVDPIEYFVESKKGSSKHIANFATLLYRTMGIPARYVEGYLAWDQIGLQEISVNFSHKWGWTEVYLDGIGWVDIDCCSYFGEASDNGQPGDISSKVPNKGPGKEGPESFTGERGDVLSFVSNDYSGTVYFRSKSYDTYSLGNWTYSNAYSNDSEVYNPQSYTYYSGSDIFQDVKFDVTYLKPARNACAPEYSLVSANGTDNDYAGAVVAGETKTFKTKILKSSESTFRTLQSNLSKYPDVKREERRYFNSIENLYEDLSINVGFNLGAYGSYRDIADIMLTEASLYTGEPIRNLPLLAQLFAVKDYLQNNYTYNIEYDYGESCIDPLIGFYATREGICSTFATAATLMYRALGIKSRYVVGYMAESVKNEVCYVGSKTCHAWSEVYLEGTGWVTMDCTGFEEGNGTIDPLAKDGNGGSYGDGAGGGGLVESRNVIELNYMVLKQTIEYAGREVLPEDIDTSKFFKIVSKNPSQISTTDFYNNYEILIDYVSADEKGLVPFYPWTAADYDNKAYVKYTILDKNTGECVIDSFSSTKTGNLLVDDGARFVTTQVTIAFSKPDLEIKTGDITIFEDEIEMLYDLPIADMQISGLAPFGDELNYRFDSAKVVYEDDVPHYEYEFYVIHGNYIFDETTGEFKWIAYDVTEFYNILPEWGEINFEGA